MAGNIKSRTRKLLLSLSRVFGVSVSNSFHFRVCVTLRGPIEKMLKVVVALLLCNGLTWAIVLKPTEYTNCGSTATINELSLISCTSLPCVMPQGSNATIDVVFTPKVASDTLGVKVFGVIGGVDVPYAGISDKGCDTLTKEKGGAGCPITDLTQKYTYKAAVKVKPIYPPMDLDIKFNIGNGTVCFQFPARITPPGGAA